MLEVGASRVEFREMLERVCRKVSEEYARIRERSSVLPGNVEWMEDVGRTMWRFVYCYCILKLHGACTNVNKAEAGTKQESCEFNRRLEETANSGSCMFYDYEVSCSYHT